MTLAICDSACHGAGWSTLPLTPHMFAPSLPAHGWYCSELGEAGDSAWDWIEHVEVPNVKVINL